MIGCYKELAGPLPRSQQREERAQQHAQSSLPHRSTWKGWWWNGKKAKFAKAASSLYLSFTVPIWGKMLIGL